MALSSVRRASGDREAAQPSTEDYLVRVAEIAPALAAAAPEIDQNRELPAQIVDALIERGLFRLLLPHSLGGAELLPAQYIPVIEAIAQIDASTAWCINQNSGCSMTAALLAPEIAGEIFGGPRGILAWGPGPGEARVAPGGYRVTARWSFASGSQHASWLGCHVPIVEADGTPRLRSDGTPVIRTMLFPKTSTKFTDIWHTIGLRGTASNQYEVKDLFVPEPYSVDVLSRRDGSATREAGLLYRFSSLSLYAGGFAGVALGIARAMLTHFIELARDKIPRGARNTLRNNNVIQSEVARAEARLSSAHGWLLQSFENITAAVAQRGHITLEERMVIRLASTFAIHTGVEVVDTLYQAAGATAIFNDNPFERRFRDIHSVAQQLQGRQQHFETVGQYLMGLEADTGWL
ncbi:MAG: acyl-CoA dehydrogenase family protein [Alphaproteobacteria bacterium]|nr:acyl-CoA dehydrogenase family protein [Alphaproteobacteria bacterium]MBV9150250.1 acyl-CoA dehydrogenase family protein [Alphaproteobacteria bacterium]